MSRLLYILPSKMYLRLQNCNYKAISCKKNSIYLVFKKAKVKKKNKKKSSINFLTNATSKAYRNHCRKEREPIFLKRFLFLFGSVQLGV